MSRDRNFENNKARVDVKISYINTTSASGTPLFLFSFISFLPGSLVSRTLSADKVGGESCDPNSRTFIHSLWSVWACPHTTIFFHSSHFLIITEVFLVLRRNLAGTDRKSLQHLSEMHEYGIGWVVLLLPY